MWKPSCGKPIHRLPQLQSKEGKVGIKRIKKREKLELSLNDIWLSGFSCSYQVLLLGVNWESVWDELKIRQVNGFYKHTISSNAWWSFNINVIWGENYQESTHMHTAKEKFKKEKLKIRNNGRYKSLTLFNVSSWVTRWNACKECGNSGGAIGSQEPSLGALIRIKICQLKHKKGHGTQNMKL